MSQVIFTFEDGSQALMHYGVLGMKWGVRNEETLRKYLGGHRSERTVKLDKRYQEKHQKAREYNDWANENHLTTDKWSNRKVYDDPDVAYNVHKMYGKSANVLSKVYASKMRDASLLPDIGFYLTVKMGVMSPKDVDEMVDTSVKRALKDLKNERAERSSTNGHGRRQP